MPNSDDRFDGRDGAPSDHFDGDDRFDKLSASQLSEALLRAARDEDGDDLAELLALGADARACDRHGNTPLMAAAANGDAQSVRALLPHSDARARNARGTDALMAAAAVPSLPCVQLLLPASDARAANREKDTALTRAIEANGVSCAKLLLPHSDLSARNAEGRTPLMLAAVWGNAAILLSLLPFSDLEATAADGKTIFSIAQSSGDLACMEALAGLATHDEVLFALRALRAAGGEPSAPRLKARAESIEIAAAAQGAGSSGLPRRGPRSL